MGPICCRPISNDILELTSIQRRCNVGAYRKYAYLNLLGEGYSGFLIQASGGVVSREKPSIERNATVTSHDD